MGKKYLAPEDPIHLYLTEWADVRKYDVIKGVRKRHNIRRFLRRSLVLKIHLRTCQTPGTTAEGKKTNMAKFEARALLNVDTLKKFLLFYRESIIIIIIIFISSIKTIEPVFPFFLVLCVLIVMSSSIEMHTHC